MRTRPARLSAWTCRFCGSHIPASYAHKCDQSMTTDSTTEAGLVERLVREAYEEGVEDGIEWGTDPCGEPKPQWIDSCARIALIRANESLHKERERLRGGFDHNAAFRVLREDFDRLDLHHARGCVRCSPDHVCGYALGIAAAYRKMEARLSPTRAPFPTLRSSLQGDQRD